MRRRIKLVLIALLTLPGLSSSQAEPDCGDQVPSLVGPTVAVTTSGAYGPEQEGWKAFDPSERTQSMWISEVFETPAWIAYDFGVPTVVDLYRITFINGPLTSRAPKDFTLEGWDGARWVTVDSRTSQTGWVNGIPRAYNAASPGEYTKYRLHITDDNDPRPGIVVISIGDLQLSESVLSTSISCEASPRTVQCEAKIADGVEPATYRWSYAGTASVWDGHGKSVWASWPSPAACDRASVFRVTVTDACGAVRSSSKEAICAGRIP